MVAAAVAENAMPVGPVMTPVKLREASSFTTIVAPAVPVTVELPPTIPRAVCAALSEKRSVKICELPLRFSVEPAPIVR